MSTTNPFDDNVLAGMRGVTIATLIIVATHYDIVATAYYQCFSFSQSSTINIKLRQEYLEIFKITRPV